MRVKCRGFEGVLLEVNAHEISYNVSGVANVVSYRIKFQQETGEFIEIIGVSTDEIEVFQEKKAVFDGKDFPCISPEEIKKMKEGHNFCV